MQLSDAGVIHFNMLQYAQQSQHSTLRDKECHINAKDETLWNVSLKYHKISSYL